MHKQVISILAFLPFATWWYFSNLCTFLPGSFAANFVVTPVLYVLVTSAGMYLKGREGISRLKGSRLLFLWIIFDTFVEYFGNVSALDFRILSIASHVLLVFAVVKVFFPEEDKDQAFAGSLLCAILIAFVAFIFSGVSFYPIFDATRFLMIYLPLYRVGSLSLILLLSLKKGLDTNILWKLVFVFCLTFKFFADVFLVSGVAFGPVLTLNAHVFLSLCGSMFFFWGLAWLLEFPLSVFDLRGNGITYFRTIKTKVPVSLN